MILTPNIVIDKTHMNMFQKEFETYENTPGEEFTYYGSDDLEDCTISVKKIRTLQGNGILVAVSHKSESILICRLITAPVPQGALPWGRKIYVMDKIRVHGDYIGQDLAPAIYRWLAEHGYTIMSDSHQNQSSLAVWRKLATTNKVYTININDGMWRPYDPLKIEDWMLFGNGDLAKYWPIRLVMPAS